MRRVFGPFLHGRRWRLVVADVNGKRKAQSFGTRVEAEDAAARIQRDIMADDSVTALAGAIVASMVPVPDESAWIYALRDEGGAVIYVGVTTNPGNRFAVHNVDKVYARATISPSPMTRTLALQVEAALIRALSPRLNVNGQPWELSQASVPTLIAVTSK